MVGTLMQGNLRLPSFLTSYLSFTSIFQTVPTQIMPIDCIFESMPNSFIFIFILKKGIGVEFSQSFNFYIGLAFPFLVYFVVFSLLILIELSKNRKNYYRLLIAFIMINICIQPSLVNEGFKGLDCMELETGSSYLSSDLTMKCFTDEYYKLVKNFKIKIIIFFNFFYHLRVFTLFSQFYLFGVWFTHFFLSLFFCGWQPKNNL